MAGAIVVGVDGSEASHEALRWGADEARLRFVPLVALHAWSFISPQPIGDAGMLAVPAGDLPGQLEAESEAARAALDRAVEDVLGAEPGVEVERKLVEGDAGEVLVAESANAELVVVGSHGRSGFKAALLGSVSRHVVDHSTCPVVVVKSTTSAD
jgi:nucleotide-binding universal stress UspA family protein